MIKIGSIIFMYMLSFSCISQITPSSKYGLYSGCTEGSIKSDGCEYIDLAKDSSFTYSSPFTIASNSFTNGKWRIKNDTLILNNTLSYYSIKTKKRKSNKSGVRIGIYMSSKDKTYPAKFLQVLTDGVVDTIYQSNEDGFLNLTDTTVRSIKVRGPGCHKKWLSISEYMNNSDTIEIYCNTDQAFQIDFNNRKWVIKGDSIIIPVKQDYTRVLYKCK